MPRYKVMGHIFDPNTLSPAQVARYRNMGRAHDAVVQLRKRNIFRKFSMKRRKRTIRNSLNQNLKIPKVTKHNLLL